MNQAIADEIIALCLLCLRFIFQHPESNRCVQRVFALVMNAVSLLFIYLSTWEATRRKFDLFLIADCLWGFGVYAFVLLRFTPMLTTVQQRIYRLIVVRSTYWPIDGHCDDLNAQLADIYAWSHKIIRIFTYAAVITVGSALVVPFFDPSGLLAMAYVTPATYPIIVTLQIVYACFLCSILLAYNSLYIINCADLIAQFRILNYRIRQFKCDGGRDDMIEFLKIVQHQNYLKDVLNDLQIVHINPLIAVYLNTIISVCMEFYIVTSVSAPIGRKGRSFMYGLCIYFQLVLFSMPASLLSEEITDLSDSWYMLNWEDSSRQLKTCLPFAIMKTQKQCYFKALGLVTINKMVMIDVAKAIFSYLTIMRKFKN